MQPPEIFDRAARRRQRDRAAMRGGERFLHAAMLDGIMERLDVVVRDFADVLDLGCFGGDFAAPAGARVARVDPGFGFARAAGGVQADEDRLPVADASFDLVVSAGVLDQVGDLPGALSLIRRVLRPDGLFLGAFLGGNTLSTLRGVLRDSEPGVMRAHPMVDVRSAGDLLVRAGFALPVADVETLTVRYRDVSRLLEDLRAGAATNILAERHPLTRAALAQAAAGFAAQADVEGRTAERFDLIFLTGWAPSPDQPKPARRGSATASLATALNQGRGSP